MLLRTENGQSITWIELLSIVLASVVWWPALKGQRVTIHCDNMGANAHGSSELGLHTAGCQKSCICLSSLGCTISFSCRQFMLKG